MGLLIANSEYIDEYASLVSQYKESMSYLAGVLDEQYDSNSSRNKLSWRSFAYYNRCVGALHSGDTKVGSELFRLAWHNEKSVSRKMSVSGLLESDGEESFNLILRELREEAAGKIGVGYLDRDVFEHERGKFIEGANLLRDCSKEIFDEAELLTSEVVLTGPSDEYHVRSASSYNLFGLIMIWADDVHSPVYYAQQIAHEAGHLRLFMLSTDDKLVTNPINDLYSAPFRLDARPMLGIFHAMFVLARMSISMFEMSKKLTGELRDEAGEKSVSAQKRFFKTAAQVKSDGELTRLGQEILEECLQEVSKISNCRSVFDEAVSATCN